MSICIAPYLYRSRLLPPSPSLFVSIGDVLPSTFGLVHVFSPNGYIVGEETTGRPKNMASIRHGQTFQLPR